MLSRIALACVIGALSMLPFLPVLNNGFVWDDELIVHTNPLIQSLDADQIKAMFTERHAGHYAPLTWLSLAFNKVALGAETARSYLVTNLILHGLNAGLIFLLFMRLLPHRETGLREVWAALGVLFYAIHPLRAESVAWVTERRDVLSLFFLLISLLAWFRMQDVRKRRWWWYGVALLAFAASLLSKAWGVSFPLILLLLIWCPLRKKSWGRQLALLLPYAALAVAAGFAAAWAQSEYAMASLASHGLAERIVQAMWSPSFYLWQSALPLELSPLYLIKHDYTPWTWPYLFGAGVTALISLTLLLRAKKQPGLLVGWLIFALILAPVSGLVQSGSQLAADRYTYVAGIVLAFGLCYLGHALSTRTPVSTPICEWAALVLLALSGWLTFQQTKIWENNLTLWTQAIDVDEGNYVAYFSRAIVGHPPDQQDAMLADLNRAIELDPKYTKAYAARGELYLDLGQPELALTDIERAIAGNPLAPQPYVSRGKLRMDTGDEAGALSDLNFALQLDESIFAAYVNRALLYQRMGHHQPALDDYAQALALNSSRWEPYYNRALLHKHRGDLHGARQDFTRVSILNPGLLEPWEELVRLDLEEQNYVLARKHLTMVLELLPTDSPKRPAVEELYQNLLKIAP